MTWSQKQPDHRTVGWETCMLAVGICRAIARLLLSKLSSSAMRAPWTPDSIRLLANSLSPIDCTHWITRSLDHTRTSTQDNTQTTLWTHTHTHTHTHMRHTDHHTHTYTDPLNHMLVGPHQHVYTRPHTYRQPHTYTDTHTYWITRSLDHIITSRTTHTETMQWPHTQLRHTDDHKQSQTHTHLRNHVLVGHTNKSARRPHP